MLIKQVIELIDILDSPSASGAAVEQYLRAIDPQANIEVYALQGPKGKTDMVKVRIPGTRGKSSGGSAPTIGLLGRLGGLGAVLSVSASFPTATALCAPCRWLPSCWT